MTADYVPPVMLRWPEHTKPGRYNDLVSTIDIVPTILTACGVDVPDNLPGLSLLDVAAGKGKLKRNAVFGEIFVHTALSLDQPALNLTHRWVREDDWKLIWPEKGKPELYNLAEDPFEEKNLASQHPEKVRHLQNIIEKWWRLRQQD
ncbi:MAG: hypothetical protein KatS3mg105_1778 [Gemmatales bacterium]|nr:MAG: hypothetical protein KatS3mg105_1778 [Gemmatales bacterium]